MNVQTNTEYGKFQHISITSKIANYVNISTFYIKTWGCQMNEYDSARISDLLKAQQLQEVTDPAAADLIVLNTCAVREKAAEKLFHQLGRWRGFKQTNPKCIFAVGGCVASEEGEKIRRRARMVDIVFGPQTYHRLPEMIRKVEAGDGPQVDVTFPRNEKFQHLPANRSSRASAFVTIMEGCSHFCSYCIVPYTRGGEVSRSVDEIVDEIKLVCDQGAAEVNLLGQNVNCYRGRNKDGSECNFPELLYRVSAIDGIQRLRFTTSNPIEFTQELIDAIGELPKIANAIHLPVQSGSDRILRLMNRPYTAAEYLDMIRRLRIVRPDISISSDFIVGFPSETDRDFQDTMDLIQEVKFDNSFSFIYSRRPNTPAAQMDDPVPLEVKRERLAQLQDRINNYAMRYSREMLGSIQQVLVEGLSQDGHQLCGKTPNNRTVNFIGHNELIGSITDVKIVDVFTHSLKGELVSAHE